MTGKTIDFDEKTEVGGFNPEGHRESKKPQVGPTPTDDPRKKAARDLKEKVVGKTPKSTD
ncbi:conserved protein of unknown function [Hyphomicrobium sp. 1Nfss2.1]|uniref:hypothetical protein n=1 Tax=Hyphomicrobium sp. 1Nfss2.1 TaxID=3413936 RepID=UPI003C7E8861